MSKQYFGHIYIIIGIIMIEVCVHLLVFLSGIAFYNSIARSRTSSIGKVDASESGGPVQSPHSPLRKICLFCWTRHFI